MEKPDSPESKTPQGSPSEPTRAPGGYISPKLREKLMAAEGGDEWNPKSSSPVPLIILVVVIVVAGGGIFATMRSNEAKHKAQVRADSLTAVKAAAESAMAMAHMDSLRAAAAESAAVADAKPGAKRAKLAAAKKAAEEMAKAAAKAAKSGAAATGKAATSVGGKLAKAASSVASGAAAVTGKAAATIGKVVGGGEGEAPKPPPAPKGPYGIQVATFLDEGRANTESGNLTTSTGLAAKVVPETSDGGTVYHIVVGSFSSQSAAEKKAISLLGKTGVSEARVVPLPK